MPSDDTIRGQIKRLLLDAEFDPAYRVEGWRLPENPPQGALLFQTIAWGAYGNFIPTYVYTALRAYPEAFVRVIYREALAPGVREALRLIRGQHSDHFEVLENVWPHTRFESGLRWLLGGAWWRGFSYGHIGDVDFLIYREEPTLLQFELDRARQVGKPFVNPVQAPYMKKMAGFSHFVICEPYFAAMRPVQERFIDNPERLLLRGPDPSLPVLSDDYRCQYQYCIPQTVGNDEWVLFHLVDEALGAAPVFTPDPPWSFAHGVHLGALRCPQPWWKIVGGALPAEETAEAEKIWREPLYRRICACLDQWFWDAQNQLIADVVLQQYRK